MSGSRQQRLAVAGLLAVAVTWGTTFPLAKTLFERMSVWDLLALRFSTAAIAMLGCFYPALRRLHRRTLGRGVALGAAYGLAQIIANLGLERTPAGVAGFITGTYVVLTPLCAAAILKTPLGVRAWAGASIALTGLGVLALHGLSIGLGQALTLTASLIYALHILVLSRVTTAADAVGLAVVQIMTTAVVCVGCAFSLQGQIQLPRNGFDLTAIVYMALVSGALAMIMQSWAQAHLPPSRVAVTMATEPIWAAALSVVFLAEPFTWRLAAGGGLILTALVLTETGRTPPPAAPLPRPPGSVRVRKVLPSRRTRPIHFTPVKRVFRVRRRTDGSTFRGRPPWRRRRPDHAP